MIDSCPACLSHDLRDLSDLRECLLCGHVFQADASITVTYDHSYISTYDRYPTEAMSQLRLGLLRSYVPPGRLLDVGYGNGAFIRAATAAGYDAFGNDVHRVPCGVRHVDLRADHTEWDAVTFFDSLEHFPVFDEVVRLFERTRVVMISTPLPPTTFPTNRDWKHYKPGEHLHYFSPRSLQALIHKPLLVECDIEDSIRGRISSRQNIYTAVFGQPT